MAQSGLGLVAEGRPILPTLNVEENLTAAARFGPPRFALKDIYAMFPSLAERRRNFMAEQIAKGIYADLAGMQGGDATFYVGGATDFELVEPISTRNTSSIRTSPVLPLRSRIN